ADLDGLRGEPRAADRDAGRRERERADALGLQGPVHGKRVAIHAVAVDADVRLRRRRALATHDEARRGAEAWIARHRVGARRVHLEMNHVTHADGVTVELQLDLRCAVGPGRTRGPQDREEPETRETEEAALHLSAIPRT